MRSESQGDGSLETSNAQLTNTDGRPGSDDEEMIDNHNGYIIQNGNLMKDGVAVASVAIFETGISLEDGQQVENGAGNVETGDGEDTDMVLGDESHIMAQDRAAD